MTGPPLPATDATADAPRAARRIGGVDMARALAVLGMLAVHFGPTNLTDAIGQLYALPHGRASILFVFVAGVGVSLMAASRTGTPADARWKLFWRAALLLPIGLLLQELDHGVFVILQTYAALFLVALLTFRLPGPVLLALALLVWILGPVLYLLALANDPGVFARVAVGWSDPVGRIVPALLAGGPYPLPVWAAPLLTGMWVGRQDLRAGRVRVALIGGGALLAVAAPMAAALAVEIWGAPAAAPSWGRLLAAEPHSQMPPWLVGSIGSAALVLGLSLLLADLLPRLTWPLVAMGQLALTVYVAHLLALHWYSDALRSREVAEAAAAVLAFGVGSALAATAWRALVRRGPLEAALDVPWRVTAFVRRRLAA